MRALAFNHFFDQDLSALRTELLDGESLVDVPYQRLHRLARRCFPEDAFTGVEPAMSGEHAAAWARYVPRAVGFADWLVAAHRPDVFVVPTDAIFYLRPVIARFRSLGVPTVVAQKETTISPMVMESHALAVGRSVPFMSDAMTVCSERQKEFWVRSGARADAITVTGQPRFDVYADRTPRSATGKPQLLYLSYDDAAYLPSDTGLPYDGDWRAMRLETEDVLDRATETWDVVVKEHPQQTEAPTRLGERVRRADRTADTRALILAADAVVGFQTTALFEAAAAGRPVLYAAWGPEVARARHLLIPFHDHPELVTPVGSAAELEHLLAAGPTGIRAPDPSASATIAEHIGPVDGQASSRTLDVIRRVAAGRSSAHGSPVKVRPSRLLRAAAVSAGEPALRAGAGVARSVGRRRLAEVSERRAHHWALERQELAAISRAALVRSRPR
jgi:hypothetical protein